MNVKLIETNIPEVLLIESERYGDDRGFFMESFVKKDFEELNIPTDFVQDNHSRSVKGVLRGIHYQDMSAPMGKLVRCTVGEILDVAVDLRVGSPTFGEHVKQTLSENNNRFLYIPVGFGHAFLSLSDRTEVHYKCTGYYSPSAEERILWNDSQLNIHWGVTSPLVSSTDLEGQTLKDYLANPAFSYVE